VINASSTLRAATSVALLSLLAQALAGCSGASSALPGGTSAALPAVAPASVAQMDSAMEPAKKKKSAETLFVSDFAKNKILVFNAAVKNSQPIRTITSGISGPNGIAVDKTGNLWVANLSAQSVTEYAPNASTPKATLSSGLNQPYDVKVDAFGDVFVANVATGSSTNFIVEYVPGVSIPVGTWPIAQGMELSGIALDNPNAGGGEMILALEYSGNPDYGYAGGLLKCPTLGSQLVCSQVPGYTFGETGGIAVAQSALESKPLIFLAVDQYVPGYDIITQGQSAKQIATGGTPEFITLNSTGKDVFVADRFYGRVDEYTYPAGKLVTTFSSEGDGQLYGVATSPSGSYH
jgi:hypothetical protein